MASHQSSVDYILEQITEAGIVYAKKHPTQDEWLKVYTAHNIHKITDLWQQRVAVEIDITSKDVDGKPLVPKEMIITMLSAGEQKPLTWDAKSSYIKTAESFAKSILEDYGVAKEYKLTVQFAHD